MKNCHWFLFQKTERQLDTKITSVDDKVNKIVEISQVTQEEVSLM